jgi:HlyD family secretion protein
VIAVLDRYDQAKRDYGRAMELYRQGGVDHKTLELAQLALEDQQVISPIDGVVLVKVREVGEILSAGSPVGVVGDRSSIWVRIYVLEGLINRVRIGQEAIVHLDGSKRTYKGRVSFIADKAEFTPRNVQTPEERVTQTFAVKITLEAPGPTLRPGVGADVDLDLREKP